MEGSSEHIVDDSRGKTRLAEEWTGFPKTRKFISRFEDIDAQYSVCGGVETPEQVFMNLDGVAGSDGEVQTNWCI